MKAKKSGQARLPELGALKMMRDRYGFITDKNGRDVFITPFQQRLVQRRNDGALFFERQVRDSVPEGTPVLFYRDVEAEVSENQAPPAAVWGRCPEGCLSLYQPPLSTHEAVERLTNSCFVIVDTGDRVEKVGDLTIHRSKPVMSEAAVA